MKRVDVVAAKVFESARGQVFDNQRLRHAETTSIGVSKTWEFHPQLLAEPGVNLSTHRAPIVPTVNGLRFRLAHALILPEELAHVWTETTRPLRSTLITSASTLIRVGPPSRCASILSTLLFFTWSFLLASQPEFP